MFECNNNNSNSSLKVPSNPINYNNNNNCNNNSSSSACMISPAKAPISSWFTLRLTCTTVSRSCRFMHTLLFPDTRTWPVESIFSTCTKINCIISLIRTTIQARFQQAIWSISLYEQCWFVRGTLIQSRSKLDSCTVTCWLLKTVKG